MLSLLHARVHLAAPVVLFVDEEPKYLGVPFTGKHGSTMVKIAAEIPPEQEEMYKNRARPVLYLP